MLRRLTLLSLASIVLCIVFALAVRIFFADVAPTTLGEEPAPFWRLETAVLLTTLQWIAGVVGLIGAVSVVVLHFRRRSAT
jgi:hypothetical protein